MAPLIALLAVLAVLCPGGTHHQPGSCHLDAGKADTACTPGATNPAVTQATIRTTICVRGWAGPMHPPTSFTRSLKRQQMIEYGLTGPPSDFKLDHLVSVELGGATRNPGNLFPQPNAASYVKDREEGRLKADVCAGRLTLAEAQRKIGVDWTSRGAR